MDARRIDATSSGRGVAQSTATGHRRIVQFQRGHPQSQHPVKDNVDMADNIRLPARRPTLDQVVRDVQALILSRQDDPFLQTSASRSCEDECHDDSAVLIERNGDSRSLSPIDVHEHMIRSPPPVIPATFRFPGGVKLDAKGGADR